MVLNRRDFNPTGPWIVVAACLRMVLNRRDFNPILHK